MGRRGQERRASPCSPPARGQERRAPHAGTYHPEEGPCGQGDILLDGGQYTEDEADQDDEEAAGQEHTQSVSQPGCPPCLLRHGPGRGGGRLAHRPGPGHIPRGLRAPRAASPDCQACTSGSTASAGGHHPARKGWALTQATGRRASEAQPKKPCTAHVVSKDPEGKFMGQRATWGPRSPRGLLWGGKCPGHRVTVAGLRGHPNSSAACSTRGLAPRPPGVQAAGPDHSPARFPIHTARDHFLSAADVQAGTQGSAPGPPEAGPVFRPSPSPPEPACPWRRFSTACPATDSVPGKDITTARTAQPHCTDSNTHPRETTASSAVERCYRQGNWGLSSTLPEGEPQEAKPRRGCGQAPGSVTAWSPPI